MTVRSRSSRDRSRAASRIAAWLFVCACAGDEPPRQGDAAIADHGDGGRSDAGAQPRADAAQPDADAAAVLRADAGSGSRSWVRADYLPQECTAEVWTGTQPPPDIPTFAWEPCPELEGCDRMLFFLDGTPIPYGSFVGIDKYWARVDDVSYVSLRNGPEDGRDRRAVYTEDGRLVVAWRAVRDADEGAYCLPASPVARGRETGTIADFAYAGGNGINGLVTILPTPELNKRQAPLLRIDAAPAGGIGAVAEWDFSLQAMAFKFLSQEVMLVSRQPGDPRRFGRPWQELEGGTNMIAVVDDTAYWDEVSDRSRIHRANLDGCHDRPVDVDGRDATAHGTGGRYVAWFELPAGKTGPVQVMLAKHEPCGTPLAPEAIGPGLESDVGGYIRVGDGVLAYLESNEPSIARVIDFEQRRQLAITFPERLVAFKPPYHAARDLLVVGLVPRRDRRLPDEPWRVDLRGRTWEPL